MTTDSTSPSTATDDPNERMALLLGWVRKSSGWWDEPYHCGCSAPPPCTWLSREFAPDYTQWDRFPELQDYVRRLGNRAILVDNALAAKIGNWTDLTPTILRGAILEVCGAGVTTP